MFYTQMLDMITENVKGDKKAMTERLSVFCRDRMADSIINTHISVICRNFHAIMRRTVVHLFLCCLF